MTETFTASPFKAFLFLFGFTQKFSFFYLRYNFVLSFIFIFSHKNFCKFIKFSLILFK